MQSGYYWFYELKDDGEPLFDRPDIAWYSDDTNELSIIGYDYGIVYNPVKHQILERIEYNPQRKEI